MILNAGSTPAAHPETGDTAAERRKATNLLVSADPQSCPTARQRRRFRHQSHHPEREPGHAGAVQQHVVDFVATSVDDLLAQADGKTVQMGSDNGGTLTLHTKVRTDTLARPVVWRADPLPDHRPQRGLRADQSRHAWYHLGVHQPRRGVPRSNWCVCACWWASWASVLCPSIWREPSSWCWPLSSLSLTYSSHPRHPDCGRHISLILGGILLINTSDAPGIPGVSPPVIAGVALALGGFFFFAMYKVFQARRGDPPRGAKTCWATSAKHAPTLAPEGMVFVSGELWSATSLTARYHPASMSASWPLMA